MSDLNKETVGCQGDDNRSENVVSIDVEETVSDDDTSEGCFTCLLRFVFGIE
jgi:hypothetical protein